jgi:hypothetical protein
MQPAQVPKVGLVSAKVLSESRKPSALEEFQHGGRFATGDDEAVEIRRGLRGAHQDGVGSGFGQSCGVGGVVALNGEDADERAEGLFGLGNSERDWRFPSAA